jgi:hypothetical protein
MQRQYAEAKAEALSYILLAMVVMLVSYAFWSHWTIANLPMEETRQLGALVRAAPALIAALVVPLMLWAIVCGKLRLADVMRRHWMIFSLAAVGVCAIVASASLLLLDDGYQWGAQDSVIATVLLIPVAVICIGLVGYAVTVRFSGKVGSH